MKKVVPKIFFILMVGACALSLGLDFSEAQEETIIPAVTSTDNNTSTPIDFSSLLVSTSTANAELLKEILDAEKLREEIMKMVEQKSEDFDIKFSPKYPGANTKISAELASYTFDANRSSIAWIIGGKTVGTGKNFSFTTGKLGSNLMLNVSVITEDGKNVSKTFNLRAVEVDILWETPGYAPLQYAGKILPVSQSLIKAAAIPRGFASSDSRLIYEWKKNGDNFPSGSGHGKKTFSFYSKMVGTDIVEVKVSSPDNNAIAYKTVEIPIGEPKILFYEEHPLEGPQYQKELSSFFRPEKTELTLRAEPFFFSKKALPLLSYEWKINNKKIEVPSRPNIINLSIPSGSKGTSLIGLSLENPKNILERALKNIRAELNL